MKALFLVALALSVSFSDLARADELTDCTAAATHPEVVWDQDLLTGCMDFYFQNEGYDLPDGSFNRVITLGYRELEINPMAREIYTQVAWLLYSKYSSWLSAPASMPDGKLKADEAVELLLKGREFLWSDAAYNQDAADTIWPLARYYRPEFYPFVIESYEHADALTPALSARIRVRLNLGHVHRERSERDLAILWYRRVLELDPANAVALKYLKQLGA